MKDKLLKVKVMAATLLLASSTYCLSGCKIGSISDYSDAEIIEEYEKRNLEEKQELEQQKIMSEEDTLYLPGQHYVKKHNDLSYHEGYELVAAYKTNGANYIYVNTSPVITNDPSEFGKVIELDNIVSEEKSQQSKK